MNLPEFPYHPDPLATGSVKPSERADGSAAERFDADYTDVLELPEGVPAAVVEEVLKRTPGFSGWQQEQWLFHCGDAAAFLGVVGRAELEPYPDALDVLRHEHEGYGWSEEEAAEYVDALDKDGQPTAYLFECRHCGTHLAYSDFT